MIGLRSRIRSRISRALLDLPFALPFLGIPENAASVRDLAHADSSAPNVRVIPAYGPQTVTRPPPLSVEPHTPEEFSVLEISLEAQFIAVVPCGSVLNQHGAVMTQEGTLLFDVSDEFGAGVDCPTGTHSAFRTLTWPVPKKITGRIAVLSTCGYDCFGHWILDALPRVFLLNEYWNDTGAIDGFLVPHDTPDYQVSMLNDLGIPSSKIIHHPAGRRVIADELVVPSCPRSCYHAHPATVYSLRETFLDTSSPVRPKRKLFVSRQSTSHRRIVNFSEIEETLASRGFEVVEPQCLSFSEQVKLFSEASLVVAQLGSVLAHYAFLPAGATVLEVLDPNTIKECAWSLSPHIPFNYSYIFSEAKDNPVFDLQADMKIDADKLNRALDVIERSQYSHPHFSHYG